MRTLAHIAAGVKAPKHSLVVYNPNSAAAYDLVTFTVPDGMGEPAVYDGETKLAVQKPQTVHMYSLQQGYLERI